MDTEKMGRFIAERRKDKHMTQKDFARMLNITDKAVSKWERGVSLREPLNKSPSFSAERENRRLPLGSSDSVGK